MVDARRASLEDRRDHDDTGLSRDTGERFGRRPGDRLREIEGAVVFPLREVLRAKELGQADDLGARGGRLAHAVDRGLDVRLGLRRAPHLDEPEPEARGR